MQNYKDIAYNLIKEMNEINTKQIGYQFLKIENHNYHLLIFDVVSSTMNLSAQWPRQYSDSQNTFVFIAKTQTDGQGQRNNTWLSPSGNIHMTILYSLTLDHLQCLSVVVGTCVATQIQKILKKTVDLKWINDIFIDDKKLSGFLIRTDFKSSDKSFYVQLGIGINVVSSPIIDSTCLKVEGYEKNDIMQLIISILPELDTAIYGYPTNKAAFIVEYNAKLKFKNEHVYIYDSELKSILTQGIFRKVNHHGNALLEKKDGNIEIVTTGRMRNKML